MCCHCWMHKVWSKKAKLMQKGEETARLWIGRFIYLMLSENCLQSNRSWQIKPCLEIERGDTMSSKGLRKANRVREKGSKVGKKLELFNKEPCILCLNKSRSVPRFAQCLYLLFNKNVHRCGPSSFDMTKKHSSTQWENTNHSYLVQLTYLAPQKKKKKQCFSNSFSS